MLKSMLKAVSKMLEESKEPKVQCAKTIIDELVSGMVHTPINAVDDTELDLEALQAKEELIN